MSNLLLKAMAQAIIDNKETEMPELIDAVNELYAPRKKTHVIYVVHVPINGVQLLSMPPDVDAVDLDQFIARYRTNATLMLVAWSFHDFTGDSAIHRITNIVEPYQLESLASPTVNNIEKVGLKSKALAREYLRCLGNQKRQISIALREYLGGQNTETA